MWSMNRRKTCEWMQFWVCDTDAHNIGVFLSVMWSGYIAPKTIKTVGLVYSNSLKLNATDMHICKTNFIQNSKFAKFCLLRVEILKEKAIR